MNQTIFLMIILIYRFSTFAEKVCNSIEITNQHDFENLKDCTKVLGHISISNFQLNETTVALPVEDITDYLLIYRVENLITLEKIFPNLTVIRGHRLLFNKYSLVVYQNRDIRDLGLKSLLKILSGAVHIESNPVLCFLNTIDWIHLLEKPSVQHFSFKGNSEPNECALCLKSIKNPDTQYFNASCWNLKNFQLKKLFTPTNHCAAESHQSCCSSLCLTGCLAEDCRICKHFKNVQGTCIEFCSFPYYTLADRCISEKECRQKGLIPHAGSCISSCPKGYKLDVLNDLNQCSLLCNRNFTIRSKNDLEDIKGCVIIRGSLHIELKDDKSKIIADLEQTLGEIREITGSLKVTKSAQLVSLGLFKKLDTIKGDELINGEISLYVVDNTYLEEIWPDNHRVAILKGRIFFHLNPRLCYENILRLAPSIKSYDKIRVQDASLNSNGERVICGENIKKLYPVVEDKNATAVRTKLDPLHSSEKQVILGYFYYFKEAPIKNVSIYDGRNGCGQDNWKMDLSIGCNVRYVFSNLKPFTQYAYFVKTLTMVDYHMKKAWISSVEYFKTSAMKPGQVKRMYTTALSGKTIIIHWWPPRDCNGIINKYILRFEKIYQYTNQSHARRFNSGSREERCDCGFQIDNRGPPPDDLNYYNRENNIIDDAISNFVFVSSETIRRLEEERRLEDNTRRRRSTKSFQETPVFKADDLQLTANSSEQSSIEHEKANELKFKNHLEEIERKSLLEQDTGKEDFPIIQPLPVCSITSPSLQYQNKHNCVPLEHYEGINIPAYTHSYTLDDLESNVVYKIYIRACVEGLKNPCGPERSIEAMTLSKSIDHLLNGS